MAEGIDATSFEFYEGIRIFVPGAVALGLGLGVAKTFDLPTYGLTQNGLAAFFTAFAVGLVLYFIDAPARAAVFFPEQPTDTINSWDFPAGYEKRHVLNRYFVMLDEVMPGSVRARALYMGSMYRIGFEAVYLLFGSAVGVFLTPAFTTTEGSPRFHGLPAVLCIGIASIASGTFCIYRYFRSRDAAARRQRREPDPRTVRRSTPDYVIVGVLLAAFGTSEAFRDSLQSWVLAIPPVGTATLWAFRYFKGYSTSGRGFVAEIVHNLKTWRRLIKPPTHPAGEGSEATSASGNKRKPIDAIHAVFLAGVAGTMASAAQATSPERSDHQLSGSQIAVWAAAVVISLVLVAARGHERRLRGAYTTQNTWLRLHQQEILDKYFRTAPVSRGSGSRPDDIPDVGEPTATPDIRPRPGPR